METIDRIKRFYLDHLPEARIEKGILRAPCPFCREDTPGTLVAVMNPDSFFAGYYRCLNRCRPGGFPLHFGRQRGLDPGLVPGFDPDREPFVRDIVYPIKNLMPDIIKNASLMGESEYGFFQEFGVSPAVVDEQRIGYNGRYLVYPYFQEDGNCYSARCVLPGRPEDNFWTGDENFFGAEFRIFDMLEIERCEDGALFIVEGENNLLTLKELGYPGVAVPAATDLEHLDAQRLECVQYVFLVVNNSPESLMAARQTAMRIGFKVRILQWPSNSSRNYNLCDMAMEKGSAFRGAVAAMIQKSKAFSPFSSPEKEQRRFFGFVEQTMGKELAGPSTGFDKLDKALNGIRGINIMGGPPKAGKSCFYMQVSTEMARRRTPVIYFDFENGRNKIYYRTLCRLSRLSEEQIRKQFREEAVAKQLKKTHNEFKDMLKFFRVVTDRRLNPDIMRRQIDFLQHETRLDYTVVVVDSLHKLPFKDLSDRRTGIDSWLRHMEAIRDEQNVSFFVISELSRGEGGKYEKKPDLGAFKESGDIEYSADNAMILMPDWNPVDPISSSQRESSLWLVASRENSPGRIATYQLEYPYWGFTEA